MPDRRTILVLGTLVVAMTLASGLLLLLEPGPDTPLRGLPLAAVRNTAEPRSAIFSTQDPVQPERWQAIVVQFSGSARGSAETIGAMHERLGIGGLGYHFVLTNGQGGPDGQIEIGYRWSQQDDGGYSGGPHSLWYNQHAIGICVVGDIRTQPPTEAQFQQLLALVTQLQARLGIGADRVLVQGQRPSTLNAATARLAPPNAFPLARFRQQLLTGGL